ncbi:MAG: hypothetical protein PHE49_09550 [bacterium]|nr:hypothetical protein [bacterium]
MAKIRIDNLFKELGIAEATSEKEIEEISARLKKGKDAVKAEMNEFDRAIADWLDGSVLDNED